MSLVVDVQTAVLEKAYRRDAIVANMASLVDRARRERVPVVWVQHCDERPTRGCDGWRLVPEPTQGEADPLAEKHYGDSFEATNLDTALTGLSVGWLIVVGRTYRCVRALYAARNDRQGI